MALTDMAAGVRGFNGQVRAVMKRTRDLVAEAHVTACNRAANSTRAEAVRAVRERYPGFKAGAIRAAMQIVRASKLNPIAKVRVRGQRSPLIAFSARQNRAGTSVLITQRKTVKSAFIATMPSGHKGVFRRTKANRFVLKRQRIAELKTLSIPQAIVHHQILDRLRPFSERRYQIELARAIKFRTGRASAP